MKKIIFIFCVVLTSCIQVHTDAGPAIKETGSLIKEGIREGYKFYKTRQDSGKIAKSTDSIVRKKK